MSKQEELIQVANSRLYGNYRQLPVVLSRGKGAELFDVDGNRYVDLAAGVAVCSVGHAHPTLVQAISEQAGRLMHVSNYFYNEQNILLADELCKRTGFSRALFCNSGSEANEALIKLARRHYYELGEKNRVRIIAFENAFHGRTLGALSMTGTPKYHEGFGVPPHVTHVPYGDIEAVKKTIGPDVAAIIAEPVQGEGGVFPAPEGFFKALRNIADQNGSLLYVDEVQTGVGRLGRFFGYEASGITPDAVAMAKGLGGGFPIGVMLCTEKLAKSLPAGTHGSTFGGNPLASMAARTVLRIVDEEKLIEGARAKGELFKRLLGNLVRDLPTVCESVRGEGLLVGLVLKQGFVARDVLPAAAKAGVLVLAAGDRVLRFAPPLVISEALLEEGVSKLGGVLAALDSGRRGAA